MDLIASYACWMRGSRAFDPQTIRLTKSLAGQTDSHFYGEFSDDPALSIVASINVAGTASDTQLGNAKGISSLTALQRRMRAAGRFDCEGSRIKAKKCGFPWRLARHAEHGCRVRVALPLLGFEADAVQSGGLVRGIA